MNEDDYKKQLQEFFAEQGGVKGLCMASAQGWYVRKEDEFRKLKGLDPIPKVMPPLRDHSPSAVPSKATGQANGG